MIYAIHAGQDGPIKFGLATNPFRRLVELQTGNSEKLRILSTANVPNEVEVFIHYHLREERLNGEWFLPCVKSWNIVWAIERQSIFPDEHEISNFIADRDPAALQWQIGRLNPFASSPNTSA